MGERWRGIRRWHRSRLSEEFRRKRGYGRGLVRGLAVSGSSVLRWSRWKGWDAHRDLMIRNQLGCPSASLPVERASNRPYVSRHFGDDLVNEQACPWIYSKDRTPAGESGAGSCTVPDSSDLSMGTAQPPFHPQQLTTSGLCVSNPRWVLPLNFTLLKLELWVVSIFGFPSLILSMGVNLIVDKSNWLFPLANHQSWLNVPFNAALIPDLCFRRCSEVYFCYPCSDSMHIKISPTIGSTTYVCIRQCNP